MDRAPSYGQFCPVSMTAEVLCGRWTPLIVRELLCGTVRFNDLRRGLPRISPSLLSKRLRELVHAGVVQTVKAREGGTAEYRLTEAGEDLRPVIMGMGFWGQRWIESDLSLRNLDPTLLMWDIRRNLDPQPLPPRRCTIQFLYPELAESRRNWWLVVDAQGIDLCSTDPGYEVDLLATVPLRSMTAIWMGVATVRDELAACRLTLDGDRAVARSMQTWLGLSPFANGSRRAT